MQVDELGAGIGQVNTRLKPKVFSNCSANWSIKLPRLSRGHLGRYTPYHVRPDMSAYLIFPLCFPFILYFHLVLS